MKASEIANVPPDPLWITLRIDKAKSTVELVSISDKIYVDARNAECQKTFLFRDNVGHEMERWLTDNGVPLGEAQQLVCQIGASIRETLKENEGDG